MTELTILCRPLALNDDLRQVARLIYYTDDYIFPFMFNGNLTAAEKVLANMIRRDTIYNYKNISVALSDDKIVGIVVSQRTPLNITPNEMCDCFIESGIILDERFAKVYNEYYKLLNDEPEGIYIANVCVDKLYRGLGVATKMLETLLKKDETYHLESVKANVNALRLYQKAGFEIDYEYPGFTGVPCYRMTRPKQGDAKDGRIY